MADFTPIGELPNPIGGTMPVETTGGSYSDLEYRMVNGNKTVVKKSTGEGFAKPADLATYLGIQPHQIEWGRVLESPEPFAADVSVTPTTQQVATAITEEPVLTAQEEYTPEQQMEATEVIGEILTPSERYGALLETAGIPQAQAQLVGLFEDVKDIISKPLPELDDKEIKVKEAALAEFRKDLQTAEEEWAKEEARVMGKWGVGPIWRGRLGLMRTQKAIQMEPLYVREAVLLGDLERAERRAQQMFENAVMLQQQKVSQLGTLFGMMQGMVSSQEEQLYRMFQLDEQERLQQLQREQELTDQKRALFLDYPFFNITDTWDEIMQKVSPHITEERRRALESQQLDIATKRAGLALTRAQTSKILSEIAPLATENQKEIVRAAINKLPAAQQDSAYSAIGSMKSARDLLDLLESGELDVGPFTGWTGTVRQWFGASTDEFNRFKAGSVGFTAQYIKALSGVQVSDKERKFLLGLLPTIHKTAEVNKAGIKTAIQRLTNKYELQLGINFDDYPDVIPSMDRIKVKKLDTGETGTIPISEFNPSIYEKI